MDLIVDTATPENSKVLTNIYNYIIIYRGDTCESQIYYFSIAKFYFDKLYSQLLCNNKAVALEYFYYHTCFSYSYRFCRHFDYVCRKQKTIGLSTRNNIVVFFLHIFDCQYNISDCISI